MKFIKWKHNREVTPVHMLHLKVFLLNMTLYSAFRRILVRFQWVPGALFLGVKRPGREVDHSPPSSAEVKNAWNYTSTPPIRLHGVVLS